MPSPERLDVESDESREARLGNLFSSLSQPTTAAPAADAAFPLPPSRPCALPESDVLARARAFLPLMAASNADILARAASDPTSVSMENPSGSHVAMDVGLGVFDVQGQAPGAAQEEMGPLVERDAAVWAAAHESDSEDEEDEEGGEGESVSADADAVRQAGVLVREETGEDEAMGSGSDSETSSSDGSSEDD